MGTPSRKKRAYASALRAEQIELTRQRVLETVAALIRAGELEDLSIAKVAEKAGVSAATIYRHFPNRKALLDGVEDWLATELGRPPMPYGLDDLLQGAPTLFEYYAKNGELLKTAQATESIREVREHRRHERDRAIADLFRPLTRGLDERRANAVHALLRVLHSFDAFQIMSERFGVTDSEACEVIAWATRVLTDAVAETSENSSDKESKKTKTARARGSRRGARA